MSQPADHPQPDPERPRLKNRRPRKGFFWRWMGKCMMLVGIGTTLYGLVRLVIWLLVKLPEWIPWFQLIS